MHNRPSIIMAALVAASLTATPAQACDGAFNYGVDAYNEAIDQAHEGLALFNRGASTINEDWDAACVMISRSELLFDRSADYYRGAQDDFSDSDSECRADGRYSASREARNLRDDSRAGERDSTRLRDNARDVLDRHCR